METFNTFNNLANTWNEKNKLIKDIEGGESERIIKELGKYVKDGMNIADYGCGTGKITRELLKLDKDICIYSIDNSQNMLKELENTLNNYKNIRIINSDLKEYVNEKKFDLIIMQQVIHHIDELDKLFDNAKKSLKHNGKILVLVVGENYMNELIEYDRESDPLGRFNKRKLYSIAEKHDFNVIDFFDDRFNFKFDNIEDYKKFMYLISASSKVNKYNIDGSFNCLDKYLNKFKDNDVNVTGNYFTIVYGLKKTYDDFINNTINAYKIWAQSYSDMALEKIKNRGYTYDSLAELISGKIQEYNCCNNVLEAGIGTGLLGSRVKGLLNDIELYGIDISQEMINNINDKNIYSEIFLGDVEKFNFDGLKFNCIYTSFMLHHSYSIKNVLNKFNFILNKGGILIIVDLMLPEKENQEFNSNRHSEMNEHGAGVNYYTDNELVFMLEECGFYILDNKLIGDDIRLAHHLIISKKVK